MAYNIDKPDAIGAAKKDFSNVNSGVGRNSLGLGADQNVSFREVSVGVGGNSIGVNLYDANEFEFSKLFAFNGGLTYTAAGAGGGYSFRGSSGWFSNFISSYLTDDRDYFLPDSGGTILLENGNGSQLTDITPSQVGISVATTGVSGVVPGLGGTGANNAATVSQLDAAFSISGSVAVHSGGNLIITPPQFSHSHHVIMTITGSAGNRNIILNPTGLTPGSLIELLFNIPPVSGINIFVSGNNSLLDLTTTDGYSAKATSKFILNSSNVFDYYGGVYPA